MNKKYISLYIFIMVNLSFIFLYIYKNNTIIALSFEKQKEEKYRDSLREKKNKLMQKLCLIQNKMHIKQFAQKQLQMEPISLKQIRTLTYE